MYFSLKCYNLYCLPLYILQVTVVIWYIEMLYILQFTVWQFDIANPFVYCSLECYNFVQRTALCTEGYSGQFVTNWNALFKEGYSVAIW
jgi:hypothetical protein